MWRRERAVVCDDVSERKKVNEEEVKAEREHKKGRKACKSEKERAKEERARQ